MPYTYFRKKIFRKYVLIFTFFYMIGRRFCSSSVSEFSFSGRSLLDRAIRCKSSLPSRLFPLSLTLYAPATAGRRGMMIFS